MTHLYIELNTGLTEEVNSSIISKLYELAISGDLDETSDLKGRLHSSTAKDIHIAYLNDEFEDLYITADKLYITFTDPEVERVLMATEHIGDGTGISLADCATYGDYTIYGAPYQIFKGNTTIEYFPEFKYFTYWINKINTNLGLSNDSFSECTNLKNIDITGMTTIPRACFTGCSLSEFNPQLLLGVTSIGTLAFLNSGISGEINLPALQDVSANMFNMCSNITKVLSLGSITELKGYSFNHCTSLTQVALPTTCTTLRGRAFNDCTNLTTIYEEGSLAVTGSIVLSHISYLENLVFGTTKATSADFTGCTFTKLGNSDFLNCTNLTTVTLPSTCVELGESAFSGCTSLTTVIESGSSATNTVSLPHLIKISPYAFYNTPITSINAPSSIIEIGTAAFSKCKQLTSIDLSNTQIVSVSDKLFADSSNLQTIKLPTTVTSVGANWFPRNGSLKITGLDNVVSFPENNGEFTNEQLLYPIVYKQFNSKKSVFLTNRNSNPVAHSLYFPKITATQDGANMLYGSLRNTLFGYQSHQNGRARIRLLYYRDLQTIGYATFHNTIIENLIINNNTPPTYNSDVNNTGDTDWADILGGLSAHKGLVTILWVPDNAVSTYQQNPVYSGFTIKGINTKTNGVDYDLPRYATFADWETAAIAAEQNGNPYPNALIEEYM